MKVLHIMLSRGLGGIEQVFLDYTMMLRAEGLDVIPVVHPEALIASHAPDAIMLPNFGKWDVRAMLRLRKILQLHSPDCIITHGNRALSLVRPICGKIKLFPVAHNYWLKRFKGLQNAIAITEDVAKHLRNEGVTNVKVIPNIIKTPTTITSRDTLQTPLIIGTMGRFVHKKGFDIFIQALASLKEKNIPFQAVIGGSGEEEKTLKTLSANLNLQENIRFIGWVKDKTAFFSNLDIFCLPSRSEPFGIVLLEAFAHGIPVVSTPNEGATQISTHKKDVLLCDEKNLAEGIISLIQDDNLRQKIRKNALSTAENYHPNIIAKRLKVAII